MSGIDISVSETEQRPQNEAIRQLAQGRSNAVGEVTLTPGATSTVVTKDVDRAAANMSLYAAVNLSPLTANAAAVQWWISAKGQGTFTISHPADASTDRTFNFQIVGG